MSDDSSSRPNLVERFIAWLTPEPDNREELLELLHAAYDNNLMDADALSMIEGVMQVSEMQVRDIMIPRAQMDVVDINDPHDDILRYVIEQAHSRFPAVDGDRDNVIGILLAKDMLTLCLDDEVNLREILRPAVFRPGIEAAQRTAARVPFIAQSHRHGRRRVRRHRRHRHHRGCPRADRRRH
jgi:magnesium and cobalt transporter